MLVYGLSALGAVVTGWWGRRVSGERIRLAPGRVGARVLGSRACVGGAGPRPPGELTAPAQALPPPESGVHFCSEECAHLMRQIERMLPSSSEKSRVIQVFRNNSYFLAYG